MASARRPRRIWMGTVLVVVFSMWLRAFALRDLPVSTAYAAWVGIGVVGSAIVGMAFLGEPASVTRVIRRAKAPQR